MRDFPVFTTQYGIASLILKEIPYRGEAYIRIQDVQPGGLEEHLKECLSFCRMAGAEKVCAAGHEGLEEYPLHTCLWEMRREAEPDPALCRHLFPVTPETVRTWREHYNRAMAAVDNASTLESRDEKQILERGGAYFVHDSGRLLGIGWLEDTKLLAVAALEKGAGEAVMHTLMSLLEGETMVLEVASTNARAIHLYNKLGFLKTGEITRWHRLFP